MFGHMLLNYATSTRRRPNFYGINSHLFVTPSIYNPLVSDLVTWKEEFREIYSRVYPELPRMCQQMEEVMSHPYLYKIELTNDRARIESLCAYVGWMAMMNRPAALSANFMEMFSEQMPFSIAYPNAILSVAALFKSKDFIKKLFNLNLVNATDVMEAMSTVLCEKDGDVDMMEFLINLAQGADIKLGQEKRKRFDWDGCPLFNAIAQNNIDAVRLLLVNGFDPNVANDENFGGYLHWSVKRKKDPAIIASLLRYGADATFKTDDGSAYNIAVKLGDEKVCQVFMAYELESNHQNLEVDQAAPSRRFL